MHVNLRLQHDLLAVETEHDVHGMVELVAPDVEPDRERTPLSLALVVDRSGSMGGDKLATVKRCADFLVEQLQAEDELAIVTYDDNVDLVAPRAPVDPGRLKPAIAAIRAGGMTNLSGGWLKGLEELRGADDARARRVLLLTDGLANRGITDPDQLVGLAGRASSEDGIGTTTIGVGDGFNEHLLSQMADAARGNAWYAETVDDAPGIFADEFAGLVQLVAQNVSVEIRPSADVEMLGVLNDFPVTVVDGGLQVLVGDAYAAQRLRVVFRLHVPELAALGPAKVADVVVRWVSVADTIEEHRVTHRLLVNLVSADEAAAAVADAAVTEEVTVLLAARAADEARGLADAGDFDAARATLSAAAETIRAAAPGSDRAGDLLDQAERLERTVASMAPATYSAADAKRIHYSSRNLKNRKGR